jgi:hypothetical protein
LVARDVFRADRRQIDRGGQRFDQGGFARTVFTDEKRYGRAQLDFAEVLHQWQRKGEIGLPLR